MTASNSKSLSARAKFPKALAAAGLAAVLVGCGGGSSDDTAMEGLSQEEMDRQKMEEQQTAQQQAISTAKATFNEAQSTLQTALGSATTDQERIAAYEAMKSASDAFRDALYTNNGSAADLLIATNAYDRATSEISKLEMMIANQQKMNQQNIQQMALNSAKQTYNTEEQQFNLVLNNPTSSDDEIFDARIKFKSAAATYLDVILNNDGSDADKVLVELAIDDNDGHINNFIAVANGELQTALGILSKVDPSEKQIKDVNDAISKLSSRISDASLTSAARFPYNRAINTATTALSQASRLARDIQGEAKNYYDAIGPNNFRGNTTSYSDSDNLSHVSGSTSLTAPVERNKRINVIVNSTSIELSPSGTPLSSTLPSWDGEKFTGDDIESHVYSNSQPYSNYYTNNFTSVVNQLANSDVESVYNRRFIELTGIIFSDNSIAKVYPNQDTDNNGILNNLDATTVSGYFNGVAGTFTCASASVTDSEHVCAAQKLPSGEIILGETDLTRDNHIDTDNGSGSNKGVWTFLPDNPTDMVASYASFGYWIQKDNTGKPVRIGSFYDFTGGEKDRLRQNANLDRIIAGTATYSGVAAGRYAFYNKTSTDHSYHGGFTANASLTANFATDQISGIINNFTATDSTGIVRPVSWQVSLEPTEFNSTGEIGLSSTTGDATWTINGTRHENHDSRWSGRFSHFVDGTGDGTSPDDGTGTVLGSTRFEAPGTVTGRFSTHVSDTSGNDSARLVGAFGAEKD